MNSWLSPSMKQTRLLVTEMRDSEGGRVFPLPLILTRLSAAEFPSEPRPLLLSPIVATRMRGKWTLSSPPVFFFVVVANLLFSFILFFLLKALSSVVIL